MEYHNTLTSKEIERRTSFANMARTPGFTLDGKPAMICGLANDFATVWSFGDKKGYPISADFSWTAVEHVLTTSRKFNL